MIILITKDELMKITFFCVNSRFVQQLTGISEMLRFDVLDH